MADAKETVFRFSYDTCQQACDFCPIKDKGPETQHAVGYVTGDHRRRGVNDIGGTALDLRNIMRNLGAPAEDLAAAVSAVAFQVAEICPNAEPRFH